MSCSPPIGLGPTGISDTTLHVRRQGPNQLGSDDRGSERAHQAVDAENDDDAARGDAE